MRRRATRIAQFIVHQELNMNKIAAKWVPKMFTLLEKQHRLATTIYTLAILEEGQDSFWQDSFWQDFFLAGFLSLSHRGGDLDAPLRGGIETRIHRVEKSSERPL